MMLISDIEISKCYKCKVVKAVYADCNFNGLTNLLENTCGTLQPNDEFMVLDLSHGTLENSSYIFIQIIGVTQELLGWLWISKETDPSKVPWEKVDHGCS